MVAIAPDAPQLVNQFAKIEFSSGASPSTAPAAEFEAIFEGKAAVATDPKVLAGGSAPPSLHEFPADGQPDQDLDANDEITVNYVVSLPIVSTPAPLAPGAIANGGIEISALRDGALPQKSAISRFASAVQSAASPASESKQTGTVGEGAEFLIAPANETKGAPLEGGATPLKVESGRFAAEAEAAPVDVTREQAAGSKDGQSNFPTTDFTLPTSKQDLPPVSILSASGIFAAEAAFSAKNYPAVARAPAHASVSTAEFTLVSSRQTPDGAIEVRLDPPELGHVRVSFSHEAADGTVRAVLFAERPDTLDLVRRHIDAFKAELINQGFRNLDFSFESNPQHTPFDSRRQHGEPTGYVKAQSAGYEEDAVIARPLNAGGMDLFV